MSVMLLSSCSLFIEDEYESSELEFKNVPEHKGEGYDMAVTETDGDCEVTYQFKDNVRYLQENDLKYIVYVERDELNALIEVHYAANTPKDLLPVPGEILVSRSNDKFDWGCNHRLLKRVDEDGVHKYLGTFCNLQEIFERLEIDGTMTTQEEESYYVMSEPLDDEEAEEPAGSRPMKKEMTEEGASVTIGGSYVKATMPIPFSATIDGPAGISVGISMSKEENYYTVTTQFDFTDFSLKNMRCKLTKTVEEQNRIDISGAFSLTKRIKKFHLIKGKPFTVGPVVIVFFLDVDTSISVSVSAGMSITKHKKTVYVYTLDFYNMTCTKEETIPVNEPWKVRGEFGGSVTLEADLIIGFGIYGKVLSIRIVPFLRAGFEASMPHKAGEFYDASAGEGINFFVRVGGKLQVVLDFTWDNLFGSAKTVQEAQHLLDQAKEITDKNSQLYNDLKKDKDANDFLNDDNNEVGVTVELGPWDIKPLCATWTWFPKIDDKSFKIVKSWEGDKLLFNAEFKVTEVGFNASLLNFKYVPVLRVTEGSNVIGVYTSKENGKYGEVTKGKTYHFDLPNLESEKTYALRICYYDSPVGDDSKPLVVDKELPFFSVSPAIVISDVTPMDLVEEYDKNGGFGSEGKYEYRYQFKVDSRASIAGISNISSWGIVDKITSTTNSMSKNQNYVDRDGTYVMHWSFFHYTHYSKAFSRLEQHIKMVPRMYIEADGNLKEGTPYELKVYSDRTYQIIDNGEGFGVEDLTFSRSVSGGNNADNEVEVVLDAIEGPDGEMVWERDGFHYQKPLPTIVPFRKV